MGVHGGFGGGQRGGNRQARASGDAAGACAPWPAQKRALCVAARKSGLRPIRPVYRHGQGESAPHGAHFRRRPAAQNRTAEAYTGEPREIEDPWYTDRYDVVYDEVDAGCEALPNELEQERRIKGKHHG